ncbi:MAG: hypothetical protein JXM73_18280 [Anaerolineae bacterium]|nr:hypothetical protein [Anaerolineae bacterium]
MARSDQYVMIAVYVPAACTEAVRVAMCDAGAGTVEDGHYDRVTYVSRCVGHYRVLDKAWHQAGPAGQEHAGEQDRIEAICRRDRVEAVVRAIVAAHFYETPAITVYPVLTGEYKYWSD